MSESRTPTIGYYESPRHAYQNISTILNNYQETIVQLQAQASTSRALDKVITKTDAFVNSFAAAKRSLEEINPDNLAPIKTGEDLKSAYENLKMALEKLIEAFKKEKNQNDHNTIGGLEDAVKKLDKSIPVLNWITPDHRKRTINSTTPRNKQISTKPKTKNGFQKNKYKLLAAFLVISLIVVASVLTGGTVGAAVISLFTKATVSSEVATAVGASIFLLVTALIGALMKNTPCCDSGNKKRDQATNPLLGHSYHQIPGFGKRFSMTPRIVSDASIFFNESDIEEEPSPSLKPIFTANGGDDYSPLEPRRLQFSPALKGNQ